MKRGQLERPPSAPRREQSEMARMARPVLATIGGVLRFYHWPILVLSFLYLGSGVASVAPDEVALVLRFGRLVGEAPQDEDERDPRVHGPGLLFALPRPLDEVVRVNVKKIRTLRVFDLSYDLRGEGGPASFARSDTIDPERDGYVLTADRNVLHALVVARFRVADPVLYALGHGDPEALLRDALLSAMVEVCGRTRIDDVFEGRGELSASVQAAAQREADSRQLGVVLEGIELEELLPPIQVKPAFNSVMSAAIDGYTQWQEAEQYRGTELPRASADAQTLLARTQSEAAQRVARARGEIDAFRSLLVEYRTAPDLVRERLFRETLERALEKVRVRVIPPPEGERYEDLRITVPF